MYTGSDHYYSKLQETSVINHTNNTRLVVGFKHQQDMIKRCNRLIMIHS
jgi:hypothetical protein